MTGAGRSTAAKELEDLGFYVVDNLPPGAAAPGRAPGRREPRHRAADRRRGRRPVRRRSSTSLQANLAQRRDRAPYHAAVPRGHRRRPRPPPGGRPAAAPAAGRAAGCSTGSQRERERAGRPARRRRPGDRHLRPQRPPAHRPDRASRSATPDATAAQVTVISFGFKYGIPVDADFVADMRFLPNPLLGARAAAADRPRRRRARLRARASPAPRSSSSGYVPVLETRRRGLPRARASGS